MARLNNSFTEVQQLLNTALHPPFHDLIDGEHTSISPQSLTSGVPALYTNDGTVRDAISLPDHITTLWEPSTSIATFTEELNTPIYVARIEFTVDPASSGQIDFMAYINDTVPKVIQTTTSTFKNQISRISTLFTFYLGSETGYDLKNDGIYFEMLSDINADIYDKTLLIYRT